MTRKEWMQVHNPEEVSIKWGAGVFGCPYNYPDLVKIDPSICSLINSQCASTVTDCEKCWNTEIICDSYVDGRCMGTKETEGCDCQGDKARCDFYPEKRTEAIYEDFRKGTKTLNDRREAAGLKPIEEKAYSKILDSGDRTEFETGAVRDMRAGKGRCDLMPLDVLSNLFNDPLFFLIHKFQETGDTEHLYLAIDRFLYNWSTDTRRTTQHIMAEMCLDVAKHFEDGAVKYGDNNWRKGIPVHCYIDSAIRHYLKFLRGDKDEPHDRAVIWNLMCAIWTCDNKPELNDYAKKGG